MMKKQQSLTLKQKILVTIVFLVSALVTSEMAHLYIEKNGDENSLAIDLYEDKKTFYINRNKDKYIEYVGKLNIISFIPEDIELIIGNPGVRRNFFNYEISQAKKEYLQSIVNFEKILKVRNKLIKEKKTGEEIYKIYNEKFIEEGLNIILNRRVFIKKLSILLEILP